MEDRPKIIVVGVSSLRMVALACATQLLLSCPTICERSHNVCIIGRRGYPDDDLKYAKPSVKGKRYGPTRKGKGGKIRRW